MLAESPSTIGLLLEQLAALDPSRPLLRSGGRGSIDASQLVTLGDHLQTQLPGLDRHQRVAVILPQGLALAALNLRLASLAICIPVNPSLSDTELTELLHSAHPDWVIIPARDSQRLALCHHLGLKVALCEYDATGSIQLCTATTAISHKASTPTATSPGAQNIALVLHTSGSTAAPKRVPLSHSMLLNSASNLSRSLALEPGQTCLNMMPLFHVGALVDLLLAPLLSGGDCIISEDISAQSFFDLNEEFQPHWYQGVPTMLRDILLQARREPQCVASGSLRLLRSVSAPLPATTQKELEAVFGIPVIEIYGMTETTGLICSNPLPPEQRKPGSVGRTVGPEIKLVTQGDTNASPNQPGAIWVRGATVISAYENAHADIDMQDGWLNTGDLGYTDADGDLYLVGRSKEIINRGGEKIAPQEIDERLLALPEVADAAAFPLPHPGLGEEVAAALVIQPGHSMDSASILSRLAQDLAEFKTPRKLFTIDVLPRTAGGKLQRHRIIEQLGGLQRLSGRPTYRKPGSRLQQLVAASWERALGVANIGENDNFFDLGGDSLTATALSDQLQTRLNLTVQAALLFTSPTLKDFCAHLSTDHPDLEQQLAHQLPSGLPKVLWSELAAYTQDWPGQRSKPEGLLLLHNTRGRRTPLFWCLQAKLEFNKLARHLGEDQPIYGMRSLYRCSRKTAQDCQALAAQYVQELQHVYPTGPIYVGGFCEGGKVAFEMAQQLQASGRTIALLCLQEQFIPQLCTFPVALHYCEPSRHSPYHYFIDPERGWNKLYRGGLRVHHSQAPHQRYYREPWVDNFAETLLKDMDRAPAGIEPTPLLHLGTAACSARIQCHSPRIVAAGATLQLRVRIKNTSAISWPPTYHSGLVLIGRWLNREGEAHGEECRPNGCADLQETIPPGGSAELSLELNIPDTAGRRILNIDMVEDGIAWFSEHGSDAWRKTVYVKNGSWINSLREGRRGRSERSRIFK